MSLTSFKSHLPREILQNHETLELMCQRRSENPLEPYSYIKDKKLVAIYGQKISRTGDPGIITYGYAITTVLEESTFYFTTDLQEALDYYKAAMPKTE